MHQLPTMLGPALHLGKDTAHKALETVCSEHAWPQQCEKTSAHRFNIIAQRLGDHRTKEMLGIVGT